MFWRKIFCVLKIQKITTKKLKQITWDKVTLVKYGYEVKILKKASKLCK